MSGKWSVGRWVDGSVVGGFNKTRISQVFSVGKERTYCILIG